MQERVLRFLLDQGFPNPRLPVKKLQTNVHYEHLSSFAPELSNRSTPDWMLYLVAENGGFDGVIAKDLRQVEQPEELVALTRVHLSVVTWKAAIDDPVTAWALLVAYMPEIRKAIETHDHSIFLLPVPRLIPRENILKASHRARDLAKNQWGTSFVEQTSASLDIMREELSHRGKAELQKFLDRREIRPTRKRAGIPEMKALEERTTPQPPGDPLFP